MFYFNISYCLYDKKLKSNQKTNQVMNGITCTYSQEYVKIHCFQQCKTTLIYHFFLTL